jgi:hypothetical protein
MSEGPDRDAASATRAGLALCIFLAAAAAGLGTDAGQPRLVCDEPVHNFGIVMNLESLDHGFILRNTGGTNVLIGRVHASCGCTTTQLGTRSLAPGEQTELVVRYDFRGRRGPQHKQIHVFSNDPETPQLSLTMMGEIRRDIEVHPSAVYFGSVDPKARVERSVRIQSYRHEPFAVTGIETNGVSFFRARLASLEEAGAHDLFVTVDPGALKGGGGFVGTLVVRTDHPKYPELRIPVRAYSRTDLIVAPRQLYLPQPTDPPQALSRFMFVRSRSRQALEIRATDLPDEGIGVKAEQLGAGQYRVSLENLRHSMDWHGKAFRIHVKKPDGKEKAFEIPIRVMGTPPAPAEKKG